MANALGFVFDAAGLVLPFVLDGLKTPQAPWEAKTSVQIILGGREDTTTAGGSVPHIAL